MELKKANHRKHWSKAAKTLCSCYWVSWLSLLKCSTCNEMNSGTTNCCYPPPPPPKRPTHTSLCSVEDESNMKSYHYFHWLRLATISQGTADSWGHSLTVEVSQVLFTYCSLSNCLYQHRFFSQPRSYTYTHPHTRTYMHTYIHAHTFTSVILIHPFPLNQSRTGSFAWDHFVCQLRVVECKPSSPPPGSSVITAIWVTLNVKRSLKCLSESTAGRESNGRVHLSSRLVSAYIVMPTLLMSEPP